jgi:hypothetical protein
MIHDVETAIALNNARASLVRMVNERRNNLLAARRRAEAELARSLENLRDAVDQALDAGIPWTAISHQLGLDRSVAQRWLSEA